MGGGSRPSKAGVSDTSFGRGDERYLLRLVELVVRRERDAAAVEGAQRRAMADGDDRLAFEALLQQPIKRRLGGFIHNGGLAPGVSYTQSQSVTLPIGISGPFTLLDPI